MINLENDTIDIDEPVNGCPSCGKDVDEKNKWCDACIQSQSHIYVNTDYET